MLNDVCTWLCMKSWFEILSKHVFLKPELEISCCFFKEEKEGKDKINLLFM